MFLSQWKPAVANALLWGFFAVRPAAYADPYYNSSEPGCDGGHPSVLFCEDFETPGASGGRWYAEDCDTANQNGGVGARTKGWCGSIYANPITPAGAETCGSGITPFGQCIGNGGLHSGMGGRNMAQHRFKTPTCGSNGSELCGVKEVFVRWYAYWPTGYSFGAEKHLNVTNSDGDIAFANVQLNCGAGSASSSATPYIQIIHGADVCQPPNVSSISIASGRWYFFEMHVVADATQGSVQLWINDCGASGSSCGAAPILRTQLTGIALPGNNNGNQIETLWLENWANPASTGVGPYWDQMKAATTGPIGFAGSTADTVPPKGPTGLSVQ